MFVLIFLLSHLPIHNEAPFSLNYLYQQFAIDA